MEVEEIIEMRDEKIKLILDIQTTVIKTLFDFFIKKRFIQLLPILTSPFTDPLGPDPGSSVIKIPTIKCYGQELVLTQSMILHKQLAIALGLERIFVFSPNIRLEHKRKKFSKKHLFEFTQLDFEVVHASMRDIMKLVEEMIVDVIRKVKKERRMELKLLERRLSVPEKPFRVYTTHQLESKFGKHWEEKASKSYKAPFWVICHKREFYDREDPEKPGHYRNYDLIWPEGFGEALSGGEREWEYSRILRRMKEDGIEVSKYKAYLSIARNGFLKPSAGGGIGIERLIRFITGAKHISDIQLFKRIPGEKVII